MGRIPCCTKEQGVNRGAWSAQEDEILTSYIKAHGEGKWRHLPKRAGLKRCGKSCRLRWLNYLRPDIKRGNISPEEEDLIIRLHKLLGNRWSLIAGRLPGRTDNEIKNYWNTTLARRMKAQSSSISKTTMEEDDHMINRSNHEEKRHSADTSVGLSAAHEVPQQLAIKTKATRCTKVIQLPLQEVDHRHPERDQKDTEPGVVLSTEITSWPTPQDLNFLMDFDFGGFLLPDHLLDSNYYMQAALIGDHEIIQEKGINANYGGDCGGGNCSLISSSFDRHLAFSTEAVLDDWNKSCDFT